ncbi:peroxidasin-like [Haliotis rufescens]|uniref:peroxidasin-like n=1 Tax=Haliotis rufescens TaxID=6454 RepID=UPI001EB0855C|nr:peroxidasin-like [Haliotis rufescens]
MRDSWTICVLVLVVFCDISDSQFVRPTSKSIFYNADRIRTSNTRDYVNLHMLEVAEVTEASHGQNLRSSVDSVRSSMKAMTARKCSSRDIYRTLDAECNNLLHPSWGTPMRKLLRVLTPQYDDGRGRPRHYRGMASALPSTREVSGSCHPSDSSTTRDLEFSNMAMQWGQFLDHDITGTPEANKTKECCTDHSANGTHPDYYTGGECYPINIMPNDRYFRNPCMEFRRSMPAEQYERREQMNIITAYIDASQIYGSSTQEMTESRSFHGGLLKSGEHDMLLRNTTIKRPCLKSDSNSCFFSGDVRVNEFPSLTSLHTVFHREHNRIARNLAVINPHWDDESLFQETRKIIAAAMQVISYEEYLPIVLGRRGMRRYDLDTPYRYNPHVNPEIINSFATAAYRFGHSMIDRTLKTLRNPRHKIDQMYFRPSFNLNQNGKGLDSLIEGIIQSPCQKSDRFFTLGVTDHLFQDFPTTGISFDLAARNIQRGRDHGLPPYVAFHNFASQYYPELSRGPFVRNQDPNSPMFANMGEASHPNSDYLTHIGSSINRRRPFSPPERAQTYRPVFTPPTRQPFGFRYGSVRGKRAVGAGPPRAALSYQCLRTYKNRYEDVDLFVGGMSEDPVDGGMVGPTFAAIMGRQFKNLRHSDRFWYETPDTRIGFTSAQINELKKIALSRILCDNTHIPHIQRNVFKVPSQGNPVLDCRSAAIPVINLNLWKENVFVVGK